MSNIVAANNSFPNPQEFAMMRQMGEMAIKSGFIPTSIKTPEQAMIIMLKSRELGIAPMHGFSSIAVINGKPTMSAELMLTLIYRNFPGAKIDFVETTDKICRISASRPNGKPTEFSFSIEDAKRANLMKGPFLTYPAAMLRARATSAMARAMFPDALSGVIYTPEELGADVNGEGEIVAVKAQDQIPEAPKVDVMEGTARDHIIGGGQLRGKRLGDLINDDGHPRMQEYLHKVEKLCEDKGIPLYTWASFLKVNLERVVNEIKADLDVQAYRDIVINKKHIEEFEDADVVRVHIDGAPFDGSFEDAIRYAGGE